MNPTEEQKYINQLLQENNNICVNSCAGSGKSSTIRYLAQENQNKNFLCICFNNPNAKESMEHPDRPDNIWYRTIHSIAYQEIIDSKYKAKLSFLLFSDAEFIAKELYVKYLNNDKDFENYQNEISITNRIIKFSIETINAYCASDSANIKEFSREYFQNKLEMYDMLGNKSYFSMLVLEFGNLIQKYWQQLINPLHPAKISHEVYLKLYQLQGFNLQELYDKKENKYIKFDVLALDEAQDTTMCMLDIFKKSSIKQKLLVGDSFQQLYSWRMAVDALNMFPEYKQAYLTQSFRFGENIAELANKILASEHPNYQIKGVASVKKGNSKVILCRTNAAMLESAFYLAIQEKYYHINTNLTQIFGDMYYLSTIFWGKEPKYKNKTYGHILTKDQLLKARKIDDDVNFLLILCDAIKNIAGTLYKGIELIKKFNQENADITISTIHKAKGMEYDEVIIDNQLIKLEEEIDEEVQVAEWMENFENICLLYVTVTRAKLHCKLPNYLENYLELYHE